MGAHDNDHDGRQDGVKCNSGIEVIFDEGIFRKKENLKEKLSTMERNEEGKCNGKYTECTLSQMKHSLFFQLAYLHAQTLNVGLLALACTQRVVHGQ